MRIGSHLTLSACFVMLAACQATPAGSGSAGEPSRSAPATDEADAGIEIAGPVIEPEPFGASYLLPGAAVAHDGSYHLYPVAFSADPAVGPRVLHLRSEDGTTWTGDAGESVFVEFAVELDETGPVPSSAFVDTDGTWVMYGGGRLRGGTRPVIWRATAPAPEGPWVAHPEPVLVPSTDGWDNQITDHPAVIRTDEGFLMAYGGASSAEPNRNRIGFATSTDGITWARTVSTLDGADDGEALGPNACGIEARTMFEPHLTSSDGGLLLSFGVMSGDGEGVMQILMASSPDGTSWTCEPEQPAVVAEDIPGGPDLHSFVAFDDAGELAMLIEVLGSDRSELWGARAAGEN